MRYILLTICCTILVNMGTAQELLLKGYVQDSLGHPIEGVLVTEEEVGRNTIKTDKQGYFALKCQSDNVLIVFSHLGYREHKDRFRNIKINGRVTMLQNISAIEEVLVSTGYQTLPKERATGSFELLDNRMFNQRVSSNVLDRMEGMVSGLQFDTRDGEPLINMRGINTMSTATMRPLVVVDNFPFAGELKNINPNDVESVSFLKDAAAASIWGARAGNGVIVINLKKGPKTNGVRLDLTSSVSYFEKEDLYYQPQLGSSSFMEVEKFLFEKGYYDALYNNARNSRTTIFSPVVELLYKQKKGEVDPSFVDQQIKNFKKHDYRDDMLKYLYKNKVIQQQHIALSNSYSSGSYRMSFGYDKDWGAQINRGNQRYSLNLHNKIVFTSTLQAKVDIGYVSNSNKLNPTGINYRYLPGGRRTAIYPYIGLFDDNDTPAIWPRLYNANYVNSNAHVGLLDWTYVPMEDIYKSSGVNQNNTFNAQLGLDYTPLKGLNLGFLYSFENSPSLFESLYHEDAFYVRDLVNRYSQVANGSIVRAIPEGSIRNVSVEKAKEHRARISASYSSVLAENHRINAFVGAEFSNRNTSSSSFGSYGYDRNILTVQPVDFANLYPIYDGLAGRTRIPSLMGNQQNTNRFVSFFANAGYSYVDRYDITASARRDATNYFGVNTNDMWKPLWSIGLGWHLNKESFLEDIDWVNQLRLRATYGHSGNARAGANAYPTITYTRPLDNSISTVNRANLDRLSNPDLKWEDVRMINYALDFGVLQNKINGSVEYYTKKSTDLISDDLINPTTGFTSAIRNVGVIDGRGIDIRLNTALAIKKLRFQSSFIFSYSINEVKEFKGNISLGRTYATNGGKSLLPLTGRALYPVFSFAFNGLDPNTGDPQGLIDGAPSRNYNKIVDKPLDSLIYHGTALPPYYGSWIQSISWGNLDLSFVIGFKMGHYYQKPTIMYSSMFSSWSTHADYERRWQQPGDEKNTTVPSMSYPADNNRDLFYASSQANIIKGDIIRLQNVRLAYAIPFTKSKSNLNLFATANNLGLLWRANDSGIDTDYYDTPPSTNYSLGFTFRY